MDSLMKHYKLITRLVLISLIVSTVLVIKLLPATAASSAFVGKTAPDFVLEDVITGQNVRLSSFKGKKAVVINFWKSR